MKTIEKEIIQKLYDKKLNKEMRTQYKRAKHKDFTKWERARQIEKQNLFWPLSKKLIAKLHSKN